MTQDNKAVFACSPVGQCFGLGSVGSSPVSFAWGPPCSSWLSSAAHPGLNGPGQAHSHAWRRMLAICHVSLWIRSLPMDAGYTGCSEGSREFEQKLRGLKRPLLAILSRSLLSLLIKASHTLSPVFWGVEKENVPPREKSNNSIANTMEEFMAIFIIYHYPRIWKVYFH